MDLKTQDAIRAEGAELYVRAILMLEYGVPTSVASRNTPGYDLIAHNIENDRNCFIQVKYRGAIDSDGAKVKNYGFDFLVYVAGNIGRIGRKQKEIETQPRELYVLPRQVVETKLGKAGGLFRSPTKGGYEKYQDTWKLVLDFLQKD